MNNQSEIIKLIIETAKEVEHYNVGQVLGLMKEQQLSTLEMTNALKQIKSNQRNIVPFPVNHIHNLA